MFECRFEGKAYAAKRIGRSMVKDIDQQMIKEAEILEKLAHKNIIKLHRKFERKREIILLLPLFDIDLERELLRRRHEKQIFSLPEILFCFQQIVEGIEFIHSLNITHRDLKVFSSRQQNVTGLRQQIFC